MEKKTASDLRAYLSTFEAQYPFKRGYIAHLILNEKLTTTDVCKRIKNIVQAAEPDRQIHELALKTSVNKVKRNAVKPINHSQQWTNLLKLNQEPFAIPFKAQESHSLAAHAPAPLIQPDLEFAPLIQADLEFAPLIQPDLEFAPLIQPDLEFAPLIQPDLASASLIQPDLAPAPLIQPDLAFAQNTSETAVVVKLTSNSVNNLNESCSVCSPSPKRLRRDCDNCVTKQRTNLNMLRENKSLRLQIRTLKQHHRQERKQMAFKRLNQKIKRQSQAATLWRSKYKTLKRQFKITEKVNGSIHRTRERILKKVFEKHKKLIRSVEYLRNELAVTDVENAHLRTELCKIKETETQAVGDIKS